MAFGAGAVAGAGCGALQLLLWPQVPPTLARAALATLAWGSWGALWLGGLGFLLGEGVRAFLRPWRSRRRQALPRLMAAAGFGVAAIALLNAKDARELIPAANRQGLEVVAAFAALWGIAWLVLAGRRARRWVAAGLFGVWLAGIWWPWWGARQQEAAAAPPPALELPLRPRKALVVVWEGADLPWLLPLQDRGVMPFLQSLWARGSWGQLRTVRPFSRAASLTTLATGCSPVLHGTLGRRAYRLRFLGEEPVSLLLKGPWPSPHQLPWKLWRRAAPPPPREPLLWEVLERWGTSCAVVGWPLVFQLGPGRESLLPEEGLELDPVWEKALEEATAARPERLAATRRAFRLAAAAGVRAAVAARSAGSGVLVVHLELGNRLRPAWSEDDPGGVLELAAQFLDAQLAELWRVFGEDDAYLVVVSPYGLAPPGPWDRLLANLGLGGRFRVSPKDSPDGFLFLLGPGVARGGRVRGARVSDLLPTLMYLLELPVSRKLSGRVLLGAVDEAWAASVPLRLIPSYGQ